MLGDLPTGLQDTQPHVYQDPKPHSGGCSLVKALGLTQLEAGDFLLAAPFVAQLAASLADGRLIKLLASVGSDSPQVRYDVLVGPDRIHLDGLKPRPDCYCRSNDIVAQVRESRRQTEALRLGRSS